MLYPTYGSGGSTGSRGYRPIQGVNRKQPAKGFAIPGEGTDTPAPQTDTAAPQTDWTTMSPTPTRQGGSAGDMWGGGNGYSPTGRGHPREQRGPGSMMGDNGPGGYATGSNPSGGGYANTSTFGPDNNLIATQINPSDSASTGQAGDWTRKAGDEYSNFQYTPYQAIDTAAGGWHGVAPAGHGGDNGSDSIYNQLRTLAMSGGGGSYGGGYMPSAADNEISSKLKDLFSGVIDGPDRGKLASDSYNLLTEQGEPEYQKRLRQVGQKGAALGRLGSGMVGSDLVDESRARSTELDQARRSLATDAAGQTLNDRIAKLQAGMQMQQMQGNLSAGRAANFASANESAAKLNQDRFNNMLSLGRDVYGHERDTYGDATNERDAESKYNVGKYGRDVGEQDRRHAYEGDAADLYGKRFTDFSNYQTGERNNDAANRQEMRGERNYQYGLQQDATDNAVRQRLLEEQLLNSGFGRGQDMVNAGYGGNPGSAYSGASNYYGNQATDQFGSATDLYGNSGYARGTRGQPGTGGQAPISRGGGDTPSYQYDNGAAPASQSGNNGTYRRQGRRVVQRQAASS